MGSRVRDWLREVVSAVNRGTRPNIIVLGNESADQDSVVGALIYAHCMAIQNPHQLCVPVLPIPREDFELRTEVTEFLADQLDWQDLCFNEELQRWLPESPGNVNEDDCKIALVDQNTLPVSLAHLASRVFAVIDHHEDSGQFKQADPRIVRVTGSATTLVAEYFTATLTAQTSEHRAAIGRLLLGPLVMDTANFSRSIGRTTDADVDVACKALAWCGRLPARSPANAECGTSAIGDIGFPDKEAWLSSECIHLRQRLQAAKANVGQLSTASLLRKDFKEYLLSDKQKQIDGTVAPGGTVQQSNYGIAAVPWDLRLWAVRDGGLDQIRADALDAMVRKRGLLSLYVYRAFEDSNNANGPAEIEECTAGERKGRFCRQLAIFANDPRLEDRIARLLAQEVPELEMEKAELHENGTRQVPPSEPQVARYFNVKNIRMSRKLMQPLLHRVLGKL